MACPRCTTWAERHDVLRPVRTTIAPRAGGGCDPDAFTIASGTFLARKTAKTFRLQVADEQEHATHLPFEDMAKPSHWCLAPLHPGAFSRQLPLRLIDGVMHAEAPGGMHQRRVGSRGRSNE